MKLCRWCDRILPKDRFTLIRRNTNGKASTFLYYICKGCALVKGRMKHRKIKPGGSNQNHIAGPKTRAKNNLSYALRVGKISRQSCEICGDPKSHGHHEDYSKPLEVHWLCPKHHQMRHWKPVDSPLAEIARVMRLSL